MPTTRRKSAVAAAKPKAKRKRRNSYKPKKIGRPSAFNSKTAQEICALVAEGMALEQACKTLNINKSTVYRWAIAEPGFRDDLYRAREVRADIAFGEQLLDIADDASNDWGETANGKPIVNKELVLRSKLRIEARQFHMSRLHRETWGDKVQADIKHDFSHLTEAQRLQKARELIGLVHEIQAGPELPPPLEYRPEEPEEEPQPRQGIGARLRRL